MQAVERVLQRVTDLPFSPVAAKILQLAHDERVGCREIASLVAQDQAFTARLLKIANSSYYGQTRAVTTVSQAVPVLGIDTVSSLALALVSFSFLAHDHNPILTLWDLWEHSVGCAVWGRQIARRIGHHAEEAFIAGLLHDMGKALFYRFFKSEFLEAIKRAIPLRERFDLVIVNFVFHWIDRANPLQSVAEVDRMVRDGGLLIIGDFHPSNRLRVPYDHLENHEVHTYKQDYAEAFFSSGLYHPVCLLTADHATKKLTAEVSEDEHIGAWLLRKNTGDHYIASGVKGNGA
jgi:SAM-dependent methyltransferase